MKKTMKMIVSLVLAVMLLALMGCRDETETPKPEATQDANASQTPTATEQPTETEQPTQSVTFKPGQPYVSKMGPFRSNDTEFTAKDRDYYLSRINEHDFNAVRTFLELRDENGVRNGDKMNEWYSPDDPTTWFYSPIDNEYWMSKEGYRGYVDLVRWLEGSITYMNIAPFVQKCSSSVEGFVGELDLSNCKSLEYFSLEGSNIETVRLDGCEKLDEVIITDATSLEALNVKDTDPYHLNLINVPSLDPTLSSPIECWVLDVGKNGVKQIDWISTYIKDLTGENYFHIKLSAECEGSVYVNCYEEDDYTVFPEAIPEEGHRFIGWYDKDGNLLTTEESFEITSYMYENGIDKLSGMEFIAKFE